jgi:antitoxin component YwqK of YwqJK toxin-antitoxin module
MKIVKDGIWETYYENRQLKEKVTYKDGKAEGIWEQYYENGQLWRKTTYKNGKPIGPWEGYDEEGRLERKGTSIKDGKGITRITDFPEDEAGRSYFEWD